MMRDAIRSSLLLAVTAAAACASTSGGSSGPTMTPEQEAIVIREGHPAEMKLLKKNCQFVDMADEFEGEMQLRNLAIAKGANVAAVIVESTTHLAISSTTDTPNYHLTRTFHGSWDGDVSAVLFSCVAQ